jgi:hypothetical protein
MHDYLSATTPGYHLVSAFFARLVGTSYTALASLGSLWSLALVGTLAAACAHRSANVITGVLCALLVFASTYVHWAGAAVLPDNAAWFLVLVQILLAIRILASTEPAVHTPPLSHPRFALHALLFGAAFFACVLVRQAHAWTAGLLIAAAWLAPGSHASHTSHLASFFFPSKERIARVAMALWALVPGIAALALFVRLWDGLVPQRFAVQYPPKPLHDMLLSPAPIFVLAVFGMFAPFTIGLAWAGLQTWWRAHRALLLTLCTLVLLYSLFPITTFDFDAGRRTGLWNIARKLPSIGHISPFMVLLALAGFVVLLGLLKQTSYRHRWVLSLSLLGFSLSFAASNELWQRYAEPLVLIIIALCCACIIPSLSRITPRSALDQLMLFWSKAGPAALALALLTLSTLSTLKNPLDMRGEKPPTRDPIHQGITPPVELPPMPRDGRTLWKP